MTDLPSDRHYTGFRHAIKRAQDSICRQRHGAVVILGGRMVSSGHNKPRHDSRWMSGPCSIHAEVSAIQSSKIPFAKHRSKITLYVVRVNDEGETVLSKPCEPCQIYMRSMGVKRVYYSTDDGFSSMSL